MDFETILITKENGIATITLNRPPLNPLNRQTFIDLGKAADDLRNDSDVKVVVITGSGEKAFAAGADVTDLVKMSSVEVYDFCQSSRVSMQKLENLPYPVIAALNGLTFGGGCELALACDFRIAADSAKFGQPEVGLGIIPGGGGTQRLPRLIGMSRAKEVLYFGDVFGAVEAASIGLVNLVVPAAKLKEETLAFAARLVAKPAIALKMLKTVVNNGINLDLNSALELEIQSFAAIFSSEDAQEGLRAFFEKRQPNYIGR